MQNIGKAVKPLIKNIFKTYSFQEVTIISDWAKIVDPVIAKHTIPLKLTKARLLILAVESSAAKVNILPLLPNISEMINRYINADQIVIKSIRLEVKPQLFDEKNNKIEKKTIKVEKNDFENTKNMVSFIKDEDLKKSFHNLAATINKKSKG